ncbi:hypothetical protein GS399_10755 [Pedobacter sp. HMF7647]|uniref:Uncharacterized protein n=1 Tax=Hufsiella arboris TaxID=2695275 RepID=A0A7K1YAJ9_9SPHI|nr:hypothetical protein [Hufsiella arboris]MXV51450.1 hypothetical protein [Hufsiella arboris]
MKAFLATFLLIYTLSAPAQEKIVMSTHRFFSKTDKIAELEKALATHTGKFHQGNNKWTIYRILSGPDAGGYHQEEGPIAWTQIEPATGKTSAAEEDLYKTVAPLTSAIGAGCAIYRSDLSTSASDDFTDEISISHVFYKPGSELIMAEALGKMKKA